MFQFARRTSGAAYKYHRHCAMAIITSLIELPSTPFDLFAWQGKLLIIQVDNKCVVIYHHRQNAFAPFLSELIYHLQISGNDDCINGHYSLSFR